MKSLIAILGGVSAIAATCLAATAHAQIGIPPIRLTAWQVNLGHGGNDMMNIRIDRWSIAQERDALVEALVQKQQIGLFNALQHVPVKGRMWIPARRGVGLDLHYAWQETQPDGGRHIIVAAARHITMREIPKASARGDFPFTFIELRVNADGRGEGRMAEQAKLKVDQAKNLIPLENYAAEPVRLLNVTVEKT